MMKTDGPIKRGEALELRGVMGVTPRFPFLRVCTVQTPVFVAQFTGQVPCKGRTDNNTVRYKLGPLSGDFAHCHWFRGGTISDWWMLLAAAALAPEWLPEPVGRADRSPISLFGFPNPSVWKRARTCA